MPEPTRHEGPNVTLAEVARAAGVSDAIAAQVLGGSTKVSSEDRQAVERAAQELDYSPDLALEPQPAAQRATDCVAVVITESTTKVFGDWFFAPLVKGIYESLAEHSLLMTLVTPQSIKDMEMTRAYLTGGHVDGAILVSLHDDNQLPYQLAEANIPIVTCGRPPKGVRAGFVDCDNRQAGALAVNHLLSLGRKRIAMISGNLDLPSAIDRRAGYRDALTAAGIPLDYTLEEVGDYLPARAHMAMERLLLNHPDVDAVFVGSDEMAVAVVRVLGQARKLIPQDVLVVGFDDSPIARGCRPSLSSVRQPIEEMGRGAVEVLMRQMADPDEAPRQVIFSAEMVVRESTAGGGLLGTLD